jgi:hypothetical protein
MTARHSFLLSSMLACLLSPVVLASGIQPAAYLQMVLPSGEVGAVYLTVDSFDPEGGANVTASLFETADGDRLLELDTLDRDKGLLVQRLEHPSSGWWVELELDFGFRNLGSPLDYADPMDWSIALRDRERQEKAPLTVTVHSSDGRLVHWIEPYGEPEEGDRARKAALAELAAAFSSEPIPEATQAALRALDRFRSTQDRPRLTADKLFTPVWDALSVASDFTAERSTKGQVVKLDYQGEDFARLLNAIRRDVRRFRQSD